MEIVSFAESVRLSASSAAAIVTGFGVAKSPGVKVKAAPPVTVILESPAVRATETATFPAGALASRTVKVFELPSLRVRRVLEITS